MKKMVAPIVGSALAFAAAVAIELPAAHAQSAHYFSGTTCQSADLDPGYDLNYESGGAAANTENLDAAVVMCPLAYHESTTIDISAIEVWLKDSNNDTPQGTDDRFSCTPWMVTEGGTSYSGTTMYTCGDWYGGCSYSTSNSWTGESPLIWGDVWSSTSSVAGIAMSCRIPHSDGGVFSKIRRVKYTY